MVIYIYYLDDGVGSINLTGASTLFSETVSLVYGGFHDAESLIKTNLLTRVEKMTMTINSILVKEYCLKLALKFHLKTMRAIFFISETDLISEFLDSIFSLKLSGHPFPPPLAITATLQVENQYYFASFSTYTYIHILLYNI